MATSAGQSVMIGLRGQNTVTEAAQNLCLGRTVKEGEQNKMLPR